MKKRLCSLMLAMLMVIGLLPDTVLAAGAGTHDNLSWSLTEGGALTITGAGAMSGSDIWDFPWYYDSVSDQVIASTITSIEIGSGVTTVAPYAFYKSGATEITLPDTLTTIGNYAFDRSGLQEVSLPASLRALGYGIFYGKNLTVTFTGDAPQFDAGTFHGATVTAYYPANNVTWTTDIRQNYGGTVTWIRIGDCNHAPDAYSITGKIDPTCTEGGYTGDITCGLCGEQLQQGKEVAALGHAWTAAAYNWAEDGSACTATRICSNEASHAETAEAVITSEITKESTTTAVGETTYTAEFAVDWAEPQTMTLADIPTIPPVIVDQGTCGTDLTWTLDEEGRLTISGSGAMAYYTSSGAVPWYIYGDRITSVDLPEGLTSIGNYAFYFCTELTGIHLPEGITSIGDYAFAECTALAEIDLPENLTGIGEGAFQNCTALTEMDVPSGVTTIRKKTFDGCTGLREINLPDSLYKIEYGAFQNCSGLTALVLPNTVTSVGNAAFEGCTGLTAFILPDSVYEIGQSLFEGCTALQTVQLSARLTEIGDFMFRGCTELTEVTIPNGVAEIGYYAFENCAKLEKVTLSNRLTAIGDYVFNGCRSLTEIALPDSVTTIGKYVFGGCTSLQQVTLSEKLTALGSGTFYGCTALAELTIPESITTIGESAFYGCTGLQTIHLPEYLTSIGKWIFKDCSSLTEIDLPDGITTVYDSSFFGCTGLQKVDLPENLTTLGMSAFNGCTALTEVILPDGVTEIGNYAFANCSGLQMLSLPDELETIGSAAFNGCSSLTGQLVIPDKITEIPESAFEEASGITSLVIGKGVETIYSNMYRHAFGGMSGVTEVIFMGSTVPEGSPFMHMDNLEVIYVPADAYDAYKEAYSSYLYRVELRVYGSDDIPEEDGSGEEDSRGIEYTINRMGMYDVDTHEEYTAIPQDQFLLEVEVTNDCSNEIDTILLVQYSPEGQMLGMQYLYGRTNIGETYIFGASVDNRDGSIGCIKAFVVPQVGNMVPLAESKMIGEMEDGGSEDINISSITVSGATGSSDYIYYDDFEYDDGVFVGELWDTIEPSNTSSYDYGRLKVKVNADDSDAIIYVESDGDYTYGDDNETLYIEISEDEYDEDFVTLYITVEDSDGYEVEYELTVWLEY